jgi:DNA ligase-1
VLPPAERVSDRGLAAWVARLLALRGADPAAIKAQLIDDWRELDWNGRFLSIKLIGGGFRVGVSRLLVTRALAAHSGLDAKTIAQRLIGYTHIGSTPDAAAFEALVAPEGDARSAHGHPFPFFLAHQLNDPPATLGDPGDWLVEWKWDGIRAQLVARGGDVWLWSRGEELVTERFPELAALGARLPPGTVVDGEIVAWRDGAPRPFAELQTRIGRKVLTPKVLAAAPVALIAYDLLEQDGVDLRERPQQERRARLEAFVAALAIRAWCSRRASSARAGTTTRRCARNRASAASRASC